MKEMSHNRVDKQREAERPRVKVVLLGEEERDVLMKEKKGKVRR